MSRNDYTNYLEGKKLINHENSLNNEWGYKFFNESILN
jgi:hypothetical protein